MYYYFWTHSYQPASSKKWFRMLQVDNDIALATKWVIDNVHDSCNKQGLLCSSKV